MKARYLAKKSGGGIFELYLHTFTLFVVLFVVFELSAEPQLSQAAALQITQTPVPLIVTTAPSLTPVPPTATTAPSLTPVPPTATTAPSLTPVPPTATPLPTQTPVLPTATTIPTQTPVLPTATTAPTQIPVPTQIPAPTYTLAPTYTPAPTYTRAPTYTFAPTYTRFVTSTFTPLPSATITLTPTSDLLMPAPPQYIIPTQNYVLDAGPLRVQVYMDYNKDHLMSRDEGISNLLVIVRTIDGQWSQAGYTYDGEVVFTLPQIILPGIDIVADVPYLYQSGIIKTQQGFMSAEFVLDAPVFPAELP